MFAKILSRRSEKDCWQYSADAFGPLCTQIGAQSCWFVAGPARDLHDSIAAKVDDFLSRNQEEIIRGEAKAIMVCWNLFMVGNNPTTARPMLVIASKSSRQRQYARALLKQSKILEDWPAIRIRTVAKVPAQLKGGSASSATSNSAPESSIYLANDSLTLSGALVSIGGKGLATVGGLVKIGVSFYGFTAQHPSLGISDEEEEDSADFDGFDEDSGSDDDEDVVETTSKGSCRPWLCFSLLSRYV